MQNRKIDREILLSFLQDHLTQLDDFVFLWNGKDDADNYKSYIFTSPVDYICCYEKHELIEALSHIEKILLQGYYLAGFINYEAGFYFEDIAPFTPDGKYPLLWFGVYKDPIVYNHKDGCFSNSGKMEELLERYEKRQNQACNTLQRQTHLT